MTKKKGKGKGKTVSEESSRREEDVAAIASSSQQLVPGEEEFPSLGGVGGGQSTSGQSEKPLASKSKAAAKIQPSQIQSGPSTSSVGESVGQSGGQGDDGAVGGDTQPPLSTDDKGKGKKGPPASGSKSDDLAEQFKRFGIKEKFVARPGIGKAGKVVPLIVNYYKLTVKPFEILHYDVVVESLSPVKAGEKATGLGQSEKTKKIKAMDLNHEIFKSLVDNNPVFRGVRPVYDGQKSLYSSQELNIGRNEWRGITVLTGNGRTEGERFAVTIKYASNIIVDPKRVPEEKAIQALEILFRYGPRFAPQPKICLRSLVFGQEYLKGRDLGKNMKLAYGYYGSVKSTRSGLAINIDRAATVFYGGGPLIDVMRKIVNIRPPFIMGDYERSQLEAALKGLKVEVLHLPYRRKFTIHLLTAKTASELTFENEGKLVSVKQYFESKYASFFRKPRSDVNPNLPCIKTTNGKYLPMEVCQILPHQRRPGKLPDDIIAEMTRQSAMMKPVDRFASIQNSRDIVVQDGANYLQQFGVSVDPKPMKITGRVLPLPQLQNKRGGAVVPVRPRNVGSWKMMDEQHFYHPIALRCWIIVNLTTVQVKDLKEFLGKLTEVARKFGVAVSVPSAPPLTLNYRQIRGRVSSEVFEKALTKLPKLQLILFILPKDEGVYEEVKHAGDVVHGIATQCVAEDRFGPTIKGQRRFPPLAFNDDYLFNLLQKINTRLGGINTCLAPISKPPQLQGSTMIVGIDASHPAPGDKVSRSVAACVASMDKEYARYLVSVRAQEPFVNVRVDNEDRSRLMEEIVRLDEMMFVLLTNYREMNKTLPERIIIFRDGVSDGQFDHVFRYEIVALKNSFAKFGNYNPKLTVVIVQKRHHTRFMPDAERGYQSELRSGNVMPGTCVDDFITSPVLFDYYLCSHEGALGTSRPARYCVLYDDCSMDADTLQKITYHLCYIYGRCLKPISIPAPVGYAHLASKKAREHLKSQRDIGLTLVSSQESIDTTRSMRRNNSYFI